MRWQFNACATACHVMWDECTHYIHTLHTFIWPFTRGASHVRELLTVDITLHHFACGIPIGALRSTTWGVHGRRSLLTVQCRVESRHFCKHSTQVHWSTHRRSKRFSLRREAAPSIPSSNLHRRGAFRSSANLSSTRDVDRVSGLKFEELRSQDGG